MRTDDSYDANRAGTYTLGGWEKKMCAVCGKRVIAKNGIFCHPIGKEPYSLHHDCAEEYRKGG